MENKQNGTLTTLLNGATLEIFKKYLLYIIILALSFTVIKLYSDKQKMHEEDVREKQQQYLDAQKDKEDWKRSQEETKEILKNMVEEQSRQNRRNYENNDYDK